MKKNLLFLIIILIITASIKINYVFNNSLKEQLIFPEINYDDVDAVRGMDIIICTSADNNDQGLALLKKFNFPFRK